MAVICKNCGFSNNEGDEFCGSCGKYLEWSGVAAQDAQPAPPPPGDGAISGVAAVGAAAAAGDAGGAVSPPPPPIDDSTTAMPVPPPPPVTTGGGAPPPPPPGGAAPTQVGGRGPDVICWNCGRRNPGGRTFCIQCGERLAAGKPTSAVKGAAVAAAAGGAAGTAAPPPPPGGGPNLKVIGIGAAIVIALLVVAVVAASFLGGTTAPTATPTLIAFGSPTPSSGSSPTGSAVLPTDTGLGPTDSPATATGTPVTPSTGPTDTPGPTRTPRPTGTKPPNDATCANAGNRKHSLSFGSNDAKWTVPGRTAWCVKAVTFTKGSGNAKLKLFLTNSAFDVSPYGWSEVIQPTGFGGSSTYSADLNQPPLPFGYDNIPSGTVIRFDIECDGGGCSGAVTITYVAVRIR